MSRPGFLHRIRSYIWKEDEQTHRANVDLDDENKVIPAPLPPKSSIDRSYVAATDSPNEELRSFFEQAGDRELSKIEVLGVLNLISQAVARDDSVLDLSSISKSANSSAFPPNISTSFSTSNIADLTGETYGGNRSLRTRSRRPLASGPKRSSAKAKSSITRSQSSHGISIPKASAPVETRPKRTLASSRSVRDFPRETRRPASEYNKIATDILDVLDSPMEVDPVPSTPAASLRRRPGLTTQDKDKVAQAFTSTPAKPVPSATSTLKPHSAFASNVSFEGRTSASKGTAPGSAPAPAPAPAPASVPAPAPALAPAQAPESVFSPAAAPSPFASARGPAKFKSPLPTGEAKHTPKPFDGSAVAHTRTPAPKAVTAPIDVDVDMDFEFPDELGTQVNATDLQRGDEYLKDFVF